MISAEILFAANTIGFLSYNIYTDFFPKIFDMMGFYSLKFDSKVDVTKTGDEQTYSLSKIRSPCHICAKPWRGNPKPNQTSHFFLKKKAIRYAAF